MTDFLDAEQALDFDGIANQLVEEGVANSPAYLHGGISGVFAGAGNVPAEDCLAAVSQALELGLHGELAQSCLGLCAATELALRDEGFGFQLFLPDDEEDIELRVGAVAEWCRGFLAAYALVLPRAPAGSEGAGLDEETGETLRDIAAIAEAGFNAEGDEEEAEGQLFELTEYLRFATLNLFMNRLLEAEDDVARDGNEPGDEL